MVVATPCPLILAAPIALVGGLSGAAREGVIVKGAGVLERLGAAGTVLLDKTGTVTSGDPELEQIVVADGLPADEVLRLAASLDQLSAHVLAESLVREATERGLRLSTPVEVVEDPGRGIAGLVEGRGVAVGSSGWLEEQGYVGRARLARGLDGGEGAGRAKVLVGVDGRLAGRDRDGRPPPAGRRDDRRRPARRGDRARRPRERRPDRGRAGGRCIASASTRSSRSRPPKASSSSSSRLERDPTGWS